MYHCHPRKNFKFDVEFALEMMIEIETMDNHIFKQLHEKLKLDYDEYSYTIGYHLVKLEEAKLLKLDSIELAQGMQLIHFANMTYQGHEFIRNMNNSTVKAKIFKKLKDSSGEISLDVLKTLASKFAIEFFTQ